MTTTNQVCFRHLGVKDLHTLSGYEAVGGYQTFRRIIRDQVPPQKIVEEVKRANIRGRGGAGFPTGTKWSFVSDKVPGPKYLVCNSDEGEPGTCKDCLILHDNPHQLLEGMLIAGYTLGCVVGYNYMRGEFWAHFQRCEAAVHEARQAGLLGKNILGTDFSYDIHNFLGAGSYIVGEETAMLESLEGKPPRPRYKPPFPAISGLYGRSTTVNNTETLASIPVIMEKGGEWFANLGCKNSGGTKLFCVSGHVKNPGVFEVGLGTPFRSILEMAGGMRKNRACKAVIPGGSSMKVVPGDIMLKANMDYDSMEAVGTALGSGGIIVMDDTTCMVDALGNLSKFYRDESCGQCTPCREGTGWVLRLVNRILSGNALPGDTVKLRHAGQNIEGRTICAFGEAIAWPVTSFVDHFREEFEYFEKHGKSMVTGKVGRIYE